MERTVLLSLALLLALFSFPSSVFAENDPGAPELFQKKVYLDKRTISIKEVIEDQKRLIDALEKRIESLVYDKYAKTLTFKGVNLRLSNGQNPRVPNGKGNIIIGTNRANDGVKRTGSHNIIVGQYCSYTGVGGICGGSGNTIEGMFSSVLSGYFNKASGKYNIVVSGTENRALGFQTVVVGGVDNEAGGDMQGGLTDGRYNVVVGGYRNTNRIAYSVVLGGLETSVTGTEAGVYGVKP
eukprot:Nk52_evm24s2579 gene=Nk52_evmTU24s2579